MYQEEKNVIKFIYLMLLRQLHRDEESFTKATVLEMRREYRIKN